MKRSLALLLAAALLMLLCPTFALADNTLLDSGACGEDVSYTLSDVDGVVTLRIFGTGAMWDYRPSFEEAVSSDVAGLTASPWAADLFSGKIERIVVEDGVTSIGACAFYLWRQENGMITLPATVERLGAYCLFGAKASALCLPKNLKTIDDCALAGAFDALTIAEGNTAFVLSDGVLYAADGCTLVWYPHTRTDDAFTVPNTVTALGAGAFCCAAHLTVLILPAALTTLGERTFSGCTALSSVSLPDAVSELPFACFESCTAMESFVCPDGLTTICRFAFSRCDALNSITPNDGLRTMEADVFAWSNALSELSFPASMTTIHGACTRYSSIHTLSVDPESAAFKSVDGMVLTKDGATLVALPCVPLSDTVTIPDGVTAIGDHCGSGMTYVKTLVFPSSVRTVGAYAFRDLTSCDSAGCRVILNEGLLSVGDWAFCDCRHAGFLCVPSTVETLGARALLRAPVVFFGAPPAVQPDSLPDELYILAENKALWPLDADGNWQGVPVRIYEVPLHGDVNQDGHLTAADAASILRAVVELDVHDLLWYYIADTNGDGVSAADATALLRSVVAA